MFSHKITTKQNRLTAFRCVLMFLGLSGDGEAIELKSSRQAWQIISALNAAIDQNARQASPFRAGKDSAAGEARKK